MSLMLAPSHVIMTDRKWTEVLILRNNVSVLAWLLGLFCTFYGLTYIGIFKIKYRLNHEIISG